jgi:cardiolipin synthase
MFKLFPKRKQSAAWLSHNTVKLVTGGQEYFDLLEKMIRSAIHSIHIQVYIFDEDETGTRIALALMDASARGINVSILVDGYASGSLSTEFVKKLNDAGIHFHRFEPLWKGKGFYFGRRLHHKVVVVDTYLCLVGGLNLSNRYNDVNDTKAWLDWALYAEGEVAAALTNVCNRRWRVIIPVREDFITPFTLRLKETIAESSVRVRINDWVNRKREITQTYMEMFKTATTHITIMSPYFLPGEAIRRAIKAAIRRGVRIRVIQAGTSDIALTKHAERYMYRWLFRNKVEIFEYQTTVLHGKMAVCDDRWMTVGSYNLNNLSAYASIELNIDVDSEPFAQQVGKRLQTIIDNDCVRITEEAIQKTTLFSHLVQKAAYNILLLILFMFTFYFKQRE